MAKRRGGCGAPTPFTAKAVPLKPSLTIWRQGRRPWGAGTGRLTLVLLWQEYPTERASAEAPRAPSASTISPLASFTPAGCCRGSRSVRFDRRRECRSGRAYLPSDHRMLSAFLRNPYTRCVGFRNWVQPSGRGLDDMPPRRYCLATLRKAAFNKGRSRGERAYCSALRRARAGIFEFT